jgi:HAMP domain-containing protein
MARLHWALDMLGLRRRQTTGVAGPGPTYGTGPCGATSRVLVLEAFLDLVVARTLVEPLQHLLRLRRHVGARSPAGETPHRLPGIEPRDRFELDLLFALVDGLAEELDTFVSGDVPVCDSENVSSFISRSCLYAFSDFVHPSQILPITSSTFQNNLPYSITPRPSPMGTYYRLQSARSGPRRGRSRGRRRSAAP